jgi:ribonuclease Z
MKFTFLGTSSMVPTKERNVSAVFAEHLGDCYLFDCAEGTQRQMNIAGLNRHRVDTILLSHWHGDHVSGLIGLLQTKSKVPDPDDVIIVGPEGSEEHVAHLMETCYFHLSFDVSVIEVPREEAGPVLERDRTVVSAAYLDHGVPCVGFRVEEKTKRRVDMDRLREEGVDEGPHIGDLQRGQDIQVDGRTFDADTYTYMPETVSVGYVVDSRPCDSAVSLVSGVDALISEATFDDEHRGRAEEYKHMTAREAGELADASGVNRLFLTHFSQRFRDTSKLEDEASEVFAPVTGAYDFLEVNVSGSEGEGAE